MNSFGKNILDYDYKLIHFQTLNVSSQIIIECCIDQYYEFQKIYDLYQDRDKKRHKG